MLPTWLLRQELHLLEWILPCSKWQVGEGVNPSLNDELVTDLGRFGLSRKCPIGSKHHDRVDMALQPDEHARIL